MKKGLFCLIFLALFAVCFASQVSDMRDGFVRAFAEHGSTLSDTDKIYLQKVREGVYPRPTAQNMVDITFCLETANRNAINLRQATLNDQLGVYYYLGGEHGLPLVVIQRNWGIFRSNSPNSALEFMSSRCPKLEGLYN